MHFQYFIYFHLNLCQTEGKELLQRLTKLCSQAVPLFVCMYGTVRRGQQLPPDGVPAYWHLHGSAVVILMIITNFVLNNHRTNWSNNILMNKSACKQ